MRNKFNIFMLVFVVSVWALAQTQQLGSDKVIIGNKTVTDKTLEFNINQGTANPKIKANGTTQKLQFASDGINFKDIGSGSGGGSGINLIENRGFETGLTDGWTSSGGSFAPVTSGTNLLYQLISASFQATTTGQYFQSSSFTVPEILKDQDCMAKVSYKGGDSNLTLTVVDSANAQVIPLANSSVLNSTSGTKVAKLYFPCNSSNTVKLRVASTAASAAAFFDEMHIGQADFAQSKQSTYLGRITYVAAAGCSWTTTSTTFVNYSANASCNLATSTGGLVQAPATKIPAIVIPNATAGTYKFIATGRIQKGGSDIDGAAYFRFSDGTNHSQSNGIRDNQSFSGTGNVVGSITLTSTISNWNVQVQGAQDGNAAVSAFIEVAGGATLADFNIEVYFTPSGSDSVINSRCINDSACENVFSAKITSAGVVSDENLDWINGNSSISGNTHTISFNSGLFGATPNCTATATTASGSPRNVTINTQSSTQITIKTYWDATTTNIEALNITCQRSTLDFKARQTIQGFLSQNLKPAAFGVVHTSGQSIPTSVATTVVFNVKAYDTHNAFNTGTGFYVVPESGQYKCSCRVGYASYTPPSPQTLIVGMYKNGGLFAQSYLTIPAVGNLYFPMVIGTESFVSGNTIQCATTQNTGSNRSLSVNGYDSEFSCEKVAN